MNWIAVIPLIIDVLREATKLISELEDCNAKDQARAELHTVLRDFSVHQDVSTLRSNIEQVGNGGVRK